MNLVIKQVRTKLGGFVTPDNREQLDFYNPTAPYARDITSEFDPETGDVWLHGKTESVRIPSEHICCVIFARVEEPATAPAPAKAK